MKSFMSAALQETEAPKSVTESKPSTDTAVAQAPAGSTTPDAPAQDAAPPAQHAVVVMQGPLGSAITEALNKSLSKTAMTSPVQIPTGPANESLVSEFVQANGQINNAPELLSRISKSVGLVPATDDAPTAINTLLDCASKVDDIEFIMVGKVDADPNPAMVPQKSTMHIVGVDGTPSGDCIAIESVQVIVNYRKIKG